MILTKPYPYQKKGAIKIHLAKGRTLLADEMGLGKTLQVLMWLDKNPKLGPIVIVCPASLKWNWEQEILKHTGKHAEVIEGKKSPKSRNRMLLTNNIFIINYDILGSWLVWLKKLKPKVVVIDEVHYIKTYGTLRSKCTRKLCEGVEHVIGISGTPLTNRPAELWPILNLIWPEQYPKSSWPKFARKHCKPRRTRFGWQYRGATKLDELHHDLIKLGMIRRKKINVLKDLPEKTRNIVPLELSSKARKEYDFAENDLIQWVAHKYGKGRARKASRAQAFLKVSYLKRLAARLKFKMVVSWIKDCLDEQDGKIVVAAIHKPAIRAMKLHFPKCIVIDGSVKGKKRQQAVDQFQHDPKSRLFVGNIQAAGVGITLTAASIGVFAELPWAPGEVLQFEDRLHRIGQKNSVLWNFLIAKDTVEEKLCDMLQTKQKNVEAVLDGKRSESDLDLFDELLKEMQRGKLRK